MSIARYKPRAHGKGPILLCLMILCGLPWSLQAKEEPILMIDTGGHKAKIHRVIRGQIGDGDEGKIYAAALSPDNQWLAVGGWFPGIPDRRPT